jgi:thioesterase domain-containing protein
VGFKAYALTRVAEHLDPLLPLPATPSVREVLDRALRNPTAVFTLVPLAVPAIARRARVRLLNRATRVRKRVRAHPASLEEAHLRIMEKFLEKSFDLLVRYHPKPYPGSACLFVAADGDNPEPGWIDFVRGHLETFVLPGEHLDMLEEPLVLQTTDIVRQRLDTEARVAVDEGNRSSWPASPRTAAAP